MRSRICTCIANAPTLHISTSNPAWRRASLLEQEARTLEELIWTLLHQYNSAVEPQATMYRRINRLHEKAQARAQRRAITESVEMERAMKYQPEQVSPGHVYYREIAAALRNDMAVSR